MESEPNIPTPEERAEQRRKLFAVAPTPGDRFQLMFEANRIGRPLTPEEVEEFMKKRPK
jgi:hypothetical protein